MRLASVGKRVFVVGLVIVGIGGVLFQAAGAVWVPALLGVFTGLLNASVEETEPFLLVAVAFLLSSTGISNMALVGMLIDYFLGYAAVFVTGATGVVALLALCRAVRARKSLQRGTGPSSGHTEA
ncbi:MAG: hypothetical protein ACK2VD_18640 [Anaerolineae bacterium]